MPLVTVPDYLLIAAEHSRPDHLKLEDDDHLHMVIHMCELPLMDWEGDKEFWGYLTLAKFGPQEFDVLHRVTTGDTSLAKMILGTLSNPEDGAERTRKSVSTILELLQHWLHHSEDFGSSQDPGVPVRILGEVFKAVSGGLVISGTAITTAPPLAIRAGALASGTATINAAASNMRRHLVAKKPLVVYE